jgi:hypothetical protein
MISKVVQLVLLNQYHFFMLSDEVKNNSRDPFTKFMFNQKSPNIVWGTIIFVIALGEICKFLPSTDNQQLI